jgi:3'(2'),5'-bisphosphate nucleotidase
VPDRHLLSADAQQLISVIAALGPKTGAAILSFYGQPERYHIQQKSNHTPLTAADLAAHELLVRELPRIIDLPCLSEESDAAVHHNPPGDYWLIDPIDGTREFIENTGQFCIAIARIRQGRPTLGFIYAPVSGDYWYALHGQGAYQTDARGNTRRLQCRPAATPPTIITARPGLGQRMRAYLSDNFGDYRHICRGSALKFCAIAEGDADLYPKLTPTTSQWDIAAGDILLHESGGGLRLLGNHLAQYGGSDTLNPPFLAYGAGFDEAALQRYFTAMQAVLA